MGKVLIVDDSRAQRLLLKRALVKAGYDVLEAGCAQEALPLCENSAVEMVISDWSMPGMDGPTFCKTLRKRSHHYIYFILLTSRDDRSERALGLDSGADDFLTRPIDWAELKARVRAGRRIIQLQNETSEKQEIVENALSELQGIHHSLQADLKEARKLQLSLIPPPFQFYRDFDIAARLMPCGQIGGDLVGHFIVEKEILVFFSIDVSGHGVASALMTGHLSGLLSRADAGGSIVFSKWLDGETHLDSPEIVVARLNAIMLEELNTDIYFTCVLAYLNLKTGKLDFCQAGHPPPLIRDTEGQIKALGSGGPPVGLLPDMEFECVSTQLKKGEQLLLYSDGISELQISENTLLGESGLAAIWSKTGGRTSIETLASIEATLATEYQDTSIDDDISLLSVHYTGQAA